MFPWGVATENECPLILVSGRQSNPGDPASPTKI